MTKRFIIILLAVCTATGGCCSWWYFAGYKPRRAFERLLAGDDQVQIASLVITGQNKQLVIDDLATTTYLSGAFRSAAPNSYKHELGLTYNSIVYLSSGGSVECGLYVPVDRGYITISYPLDNYHLIRLPEPIPELLAKNLSQLR